MRLFIIALVALAASSCASMPGNSIRGDITVYHDVQPQSAPMKVLVLPWREELATSLEFRTFARYAEQALAAYGHTVASEPTNADHVLFLDYGIDDGTLVTRTYSVPQFGVTGYSGATTTGTVSTVGNTSYVNARTTANPTYGITGYHTGVASEQVYKRFVAVDILKISDSGDPEKIYESRLKSDGSCRNLAMLMPKFMEAIFDGFPGTSGGAKNVVLPWDGSC